ncbi:hypothetical protein E2L07_07035 [Halalkalibacterium halodurans]|uniref:glucuronate isomerase n=1 Tax=Halalkalibacterium halodurans TaxID=86665 RepID=UPI00106737FE|nr:glucuronate isomerase [Halalkalibacterium halodurans]TES55669.1 hypothetical protein E2L07_07035 [Halalkalibacterium halodurans]
MKQIIALGGGGFSMEPENPLLDTYILDQCTKANPKICFIPTASGDSEHYITKFYDFFGKQDCQPSHLSLFRPPTRDLESYLLDKEILYVGGGNTKNLLILWKEWGLDSILRKAWKEGILLAGISAGSICWFEEGGTDSYGDGQIAHATAKLLDLLDKQGALPKTILYCVNPNANYILASMIGNFTESGVRGKVQFGSAWWFNDHIDGMRRQLTDLASVGLLSNFIGMLTDSRSFLSYPRHDYFRRILCQLIGSWIKEGQLPPDMERWGQIVQDICYNNVVDYFDMKETVRL